MDQVNASLCFVSKTPSAETAKCTVTDRLIFKTGGMEGILETDIKKKGIHEFLIRQSHKLFEHHTANDHIYRSIGAGSFITIKDGKIFFVDQGEYFFCKRFCPGFFEHTTFTGGKGTHTILQS